MSTRLTVVKEKPALSALLRGRLQPRELTHEGLEELDALLAGLDRFVERYAIDVDETVDEHETATGGGLSLSVGLSLKAAVDEAQAHLLRLKTGDLSEELADPEQLQRLLERTTDRREQEACRSLAQLLEEIKKRDAKWLTREKKIIQDRARKAAARKARPAPGMQLVGDPRRAGQQSQNAEEEKAAKAEEERRREQEEDPNNRTLQIDLEDVHEIGQLLEALGYRNVNVPGEIPRTKAELTKLIGLPIGAGVNTIIRTLEERFEAQDLDPSQRYSFDKLCEVLDGGDPREHSPAAVAHQIRRDPAIADAAETQTFGFPEQVVRSKPWIPSGPGATPRPQQPGGGFTPDMDRYAG